MQRGPPAPPPHGPPQPPGAPVHYFGAALPGGYPYPPPGYAFPLTAPRKSNLAVIVAVVVVVLFVALAFFVAVLYVMVTGMAGPPDGNPTRPTVVLSPGSWSSGNLVVSIVSISGTALETASLRFHVASSTGVFYFNGASGTTTGQQGTNTMVYYNDAGGAGADLVGADDSITLHVEPNANALHGLTFEVVSGFDVVGTMVIP